MADATTTLDSPRSGDALNSIEALLLAYDRAHPDDKPALQRQLDALRESRAAAHPPPPLHVAAFPEFLLHRYTKADVERAATSRRFEANPHQVFLSKLMSPYTDQPGILLYAAVGSGKTCSSIQIAESLKHYTKRRTLVILPRNLRDQYKAAIFDVARYDPATDSMNQCTGDTYLRDIPDRHTLEPETLQKRARALVKRYYDIVVPGEFVNSVEGRRPQDIQRLFSDRVIIVDEVHNMRMSSDASEKRAPEMLRTVLRYAHNVRLVLMTATPMYDDPYELRWLMETLYSHARIPASIPRADWFQADGTTLTRSFSRTLQDFATRFVTFMRGENPYTFPARLFPSASGDRAILPAARYPREDVYGQPIPPEDQLDYLELIGTTMTPLQQAGYDAFAMEGTGVSAEEAALSTADPTGDEALDALHNRYINSKSMVSNIVYPTTDVSQRDTLTSMAGFFRVFQEGSQRMTYRYKPGVEPFLAAAHLAAFAPKMAAIVDRILSSRGVVFVYSQYVWAGVLPLALALEHRGFTRLGQHRMLSGAPGSSVTAEGRGLSYVLLTARGDVSPHNADEIAAATAADNHDGSRVKVILGTKVVTEGLDFKFLREVHVLEPWYNMNLIEQVVGRAVRNKSHVDLPPEDRNCTVYLYANMLAPPQQSRESIDFRMYRKAMQKQRRISAIERVMKQHALDCPLNEDVLSYTDMRRPVVTSQGVRHEAYPVGDRPYTRNCDYMECMDRCAVSITAKAAAGTRLQHPELLTNEWTRYHRYLSEVLTPGDYVTAEAVRDRIQVRLGVPVHDELLLAVLQSHVQHRTRLTLHAGATGYLLRKGPVFVFQREPSAVYTTMDTHLTWIERAAAKRPLVESVPLSALELESQGANTTDAASSGAQDIAAAIRDLYAHVAEAVFVDPSASDDVHVWGMVIDLMTPAQRLDLLRQAADLSPAAVEAFESGYWGSVSRGWVYDITQDTFTLATPTATGATTLAPIDSGRVRRAWEADMERLMDSEPETLAYMDMNKKGETVFKMIDPAKGAGKHSRLGSVCVQTSTFKVGDMLEWVRALDADLAAAAEAHGDALTKARLCTLYEYALRRRHSRDGMFLRPVPYALCKKLKRV